MTTEHLLAVAGPDAVLPWRPWTLRSWHATMAGAGALRLTTSGLRCEDSVSGPASTVCHRAPLSSSGHAAARQQNRSPPGRGGGLAHPACSP